MSVRSDTHFQVGFALLTLPHCRFRLASPYLHIDSRLLEQNPSGQDLPFVPKL
jgi:hypothetical protein